MISRMRKITYYNIKSQCHSYKTLTLIGFEYLNFGYEEILENKRPVKYEEFVFYRKTLRKTTENIGVPVLKG